MRPRFLLAVALIAAGARNISAQTATADGIAALIRGDDQRAAEILRPMAEEWSSNDTAAQFFLGGMYESGRGVPVDPLRACALYVRAAVRDDNPFSQEASHLFAALSARGREARGREFDQECQRLANVGFDHGFEPVTFNLAPGHSIEWTLAGATISYQGRTRREEWPLGLPGALFLPLQHTELAAGAVTRHFVHIFLWQAMATAGPWHLQWHLFEVVGDHLVRIDTPDALTTIEGKTRPTRDAVDARDFVALRVDAEGYLAWAVLKGPHAASGRIASEEERRETRDERVARDAAMKGVDWNGRYDVSRQPTAGYIDADGCGLLQVYGWTADRAEALVVRVSTDGFELSSQPATFDLARHAASIAVEAHVYGEPQQQFDFCSDVRSPSAAGSLPPERWRAIGGTMSIALSPPGIRARAPNLRRATLTLSNVVFENAAGTRVMVPRVVGLSAIVGSIGG